MEVVKKNSVRKTLSKKLLKARVGRALIRAERVKRAMEVPPKMSRRTKKGRIYSYKPPKRTDPPKPTAVSTSTTPKPTAKQQKTANPKSTAAAWIERTLRPGDYTRYDTNGLTMK